MVVAALQPLGCLPMWTAGNSFQKCNDTVNSLVGLHNQLLRQAVANLNNQTSPSTFVVVDLYSSFTSVLNGTGTELILLTYQVKRKYQPRRASHFPHISPCRRFEVQGTVEAVLCGHERRLQLWERRRERSEEVHHVQGSRVGFLLGHGSSYSSRLAGCVHQFVRSSSTALEL